MALAAPYCRKLPALSIHRSRQLNSRDDWSLDHTGKSVPYPVSCKKSLCRNVRFPIRGHLEEGSSELRATEATNGRLRLVAGRGAGGKKARGAFATRPPKRALSSGGASVARPKLRLEATLPRDPRWFRSTHWLSDSSSIPCTPTAVRSHPTTHPLWSCLRLSSFPCRC